MVFGLSHGIQDRSKTNSCIAKTLIMNTTTGFLKCSQRGESHE